MTTRSQRVRLLVTIVLAPQGDDVMIERVSLADDPSPFRDIPALGAALMEDTDLVHLSDWKQFRARKQLAQCLLMDQHEVAQGDKAIAIALHRHWSPALTAMFGRPDDPSSIRRWRRARGDGA